MVHLVLQSGCQLGSFGQCWLFKVYMIFMVLVCRLLLKWVVDRIIHDKNAVHGLGMYLLDLNFLLKSVPVDHLAQETESRSADHHESGECECFERFHSM